MTVLDDPAPADPGTRAGDRGRPRTVGRRRLRRKATDRSAPVPPLSSRLQLTRAALVLVSVLSVSLLLQLLVVSALQERAAQQNVFDGFRKKLAEGTAPVNPVNADREALAPGAAIAYIEIPRIGLRQVVVEGTSSGTMTSGPGHRRDSPYPGQAGTSIVMGRRATYGGPFGKLGDLEPGDRIEVTTGQGQFTYIVLGTRREGDPVPTPPAAGTGRLLLATADGRPFFPDGVLRVDADLDGKAAPGGGTTLYSTSTLPADQAFMASDTSTVWALVLWLQALIVLVVGFVWAWFRLGAAKAWIVFVPPLLLVGLFVTDQVARLLPNMT